EEQLEGLAQNLSAIDGELEQLAAQREQYELVSVACGSLEKLAALGAAELFWGAKAERADIERHVAAVRARLDTFSARIAEIEGRRKAVTDEIAQGREVLAILEDDLAEIHAEQEEQLHEWVLEREAEPVVARAGAMPWSRGGEDDRRFRRALGSSLAAAVLLGILVPLVDLPLPEPAEILEVPERVVELIKRDRLPPPPPPQVAQQRPEEPEPIPEPEPEVVPEPAPEPQQLVAEPAPAPTPSPPAPEPAPRERAQQSGLLAFRESFSAIAENRPAARLGADARVSNDGATAIGLPERSIVTSQAPGSSGGINLASLSRDVGGGDGGGTQIAGVATSRVESSIGPGGGGGRPLAGGGGNGTGVLAGRTDEEIQIVFDRYKASLYRLYNRELRANPTLRGQMVLRLT